MSKETKKDYANYEIPKENDILVPQEVWAQMLQLIGAVSKEHSKTVTTDEYSWYNNETFEKLSQKSQKALEKEGKLSERYHKNVDLVKTAKTERVVRDRLGLAAFNMLAESQGVFIHNVDKGNAVEKQTKEDEKTS